ncbi:hypothetical protein ATCC90586_002273 [Pythium insidiosum]|nr:hypothetical protein ATCC90586_002273 [Pythium insidiosum]
MSADRVFAGHKFYLARTLSADRRATLRELIVKLGGQVVEQLTSGCVEIVEREQLRPGQDWVAADYITDTATRGTMPSLVEYMAPMEVLPMHPGLRRQKYTPDDDACMLRFIKDNYPMYYSHTSVPARVWREAASQQLSTTSTPARRRQSDPGLAALINRISSPMVPTPTRGDKSSVVPKTATLPQMNHAIARLQAATGHSEHAVCSALFWASGVPRVALDFLRGRHDPTARSQIWSQRDDQILADLVRPDVTLQEIAQAKERGAFRLMSTERHVEDIQRRIQFLL